MSKQLPKRIADTRHEGSHTRTQHHDTLTLARILTASSHRWWSGGQLSYRSSDGQREETVAPHAAEWSAHGPDSGTQETRDTRTQSTCDRNTREQQTLLQHSRPVYRCMKYMIQSTLARQRKSMYQCLVFAATRTRLHTSYAFICVYMYLYVYLCTNTHTHTYMHNAQIPHIINMGVYVCMNGTHLFGVQHEDRPSKALLCSNKLHTCIWQSGLGDMYL